jgi:energy-coupling factor transport system permease protein
MLSGAATAVVSWWVSGHQLVVAYPDLASFPQVTLVALVGSVLGLLAAAAAPEPRMVHA